MILSDSPGDGRGQKQKAPSKRSGLFMRRVLGWLRGPFVVNWQLYFHVTPQKP